MSDFLNLILISAPVNIGYAIAAFIMLIAALRYLDRSSKHKFSEWMANADDRSKAIYFGLRILAGAILVGLIVSPPI